MKKLTELRKKRNMTRNELEKKSGVSKYSINSYERGILDINNASFKQICKLCHALDCKFEDLIDDEELLGQLQKIITLYQNCDANQCNR